MVLFQVVPTPPLLRSLCAFFIPLMLVPFVSFSSIFAGGTVLDPHSPRRDGIIDELKQRIRVSQRKYLACFV